LLVSALFLQGCATTFTRKDLNSMQKIAVVRYRTPAVEVKTLSGGIMDAIGGGALLSLAGHEVDIAASKRASRGVTFPDYGQLLAQDFASIATQEINGWPNTSVKDGPVARDYVSKDTASITLDVKHLWVTIFGGLAIEGEVTMKNPNGQTMFARHFFYRSCDYGIRKEQKAYLANNCELLVEEIPIAAQYTARDLIIKYMKQSL
jgi:hypothetical protein